MKVTEIWKTNTLAKSTLPLELFSGEYFAEAQQVNNVAKVWNDYFERLPELVSLTFETEAERTKYLSRFQQKEELEGIHSLYLPMATSSILVGYWGHTDTGFYVHVTPDMVWQQ